MPLDRRSLLKTLVTAPAIALLPNILAGCSQGPYINILLHGLFLMEFNENKLIIATPQFDCHEFLYRYHAESKPKCLPEFITMVGVVKDGHKTKFKPENLQFPSKDLGDGYVIDYEHPSQHNHRCTMILPLPHDIIGLRVDAKKNFQPQDGNIGKDILSTTSDYLATITCIQYEPAPGVKPFVINYYAEHKSPPNPDSVNAALKAAKDVCGDGFNLQMKCLADAPPLDKQFPVGVDCTDEDKLRSGPRLVDIASCPQFAIGH